MANRRVFSVLLLFRVHALWGGRRSVVIGTSAIYAFAYTGIVVVGAIGAFDIIRSLTSLRFA